MPWRETSIMEERIEFVARAVGNGGNFSKLCREFGVSRCTGYKWMRRYREVGAFTGLREYSRRPHRSPFKTSVKVERRVVGLRKRYGWGARKLEVLLNGEGIDLPEITINRIISRNGLVSNKDSHSPATRRFEREEPNDLWQMDFKGEYPLGSGYCYPLSILDDHSRYVVGLYGLPNQQGQGVYNRLVETFRRHGVPGAMLMDHGTPWWSSTNERGLTWVSVGLIKQGVRLHFSGVGHPQTQGKVERFHRTLKDGVRHRGKPTTLHGWNELFYEFRDEYNRVRPHEALGMDVPANRYEPSRRAYNPNPPEWEYPEGSIVKRLNTQGCLDLNRRRWFVCEALAKERVCIEEVENHMLVRYRHMYIREINTDSGRTIPLVLPEQQP